MTEMICIICPKGCHLRVDEEHDFEVTGQGCARGEEYGKKELCNPTRVLTSTVRIHNAAHPRCPVKTNQALPKCLIRQAMALLDTVDLEAPVKIGDIVLRDILGTGVDFVVTRTL